MDRQQGILFDATPDPPTWDLDEASDALVASVVFAGAPFGPFDYLVPESLRNHIEPGRRLRVPLGRGARNMIGYCVSVQPRAADPRVLKDVLGVIDAQPLFSPALLDLARWIADYYLCELGPVLESVVPAGVRSQAGTREQLYLSVPPDLAERLAEHKVTIKQRAILQVLTDAPMPLTLQELTTAAACSSAPIQALRNRGLIVEDVQRIQTVQADVASRTREAALTLNIHQEQALALIAGDIEKRQAGVVLLHGVTGSGKTEVYIRAIEEVIRHGRQAIVLVPEISLTPQTRQRFRARFPYVAVLHSHQSDAERHAHWQQIARGEVQVIVGARSAVFAPTPRLGLIVIDEEHDASFKQDSVPRYHAREVAWQRCLAAGVPLVLGSATPSLESWHRAQTGQYRLVSLPERATQHPLPDVTMIDLRTEFRRGATAGSISRPLGQAIRAALHEGGQVIVLLNRRGFATSIQCPACGYVARCPDCDLALTHHRADGIAACHYCDFQMLAPQRCPDCKFEGIRFGGLGTERLEEELRSRFPDTPLLRMDSDTMKKPGSHEQALARFRSGEVRILVGTQMIAKGLDFPNVTLVGVINADTALHFPDFRAAERTFQLVTQVAGRTGRGTRGGHVVVQTFNPDHPAIQAAARHDYVRFAEQELPQRSQFGYPPFACLVRVIVRGEVTTAASGYADCFAQQLRAEWQRSGLAARLLGPAPCPIARLRGKSRFHLLAQSVAGAGLRASVGAIAKSIEPPRGVQILVDVDALDML